MEDSVYNETDQMKICWTNILYINETDGVKNGWAEYQVAMYYPAEIEVKKSVPKKHRNYKIEIGDGKFEVFQFEVLDEGEGFILSKLEDTACGVGQYLTKTFFTKPDKRGKHIVLRLSKHLPTGLELERDVGDLEDGELWSVTERGEEQSFGLVANYTSLPISDEYIFTSPPELSPMVKRPSGLRALPILTEPAIETTMPSVESCSPLLTRLYAGHEILPDLCHLAKNEKVVLKGDIYVSRKHLNENGESDTAKSEVSDPLFVIHENTEIERSINALEDKNKR
ncbi:uncharacterized protein [Euwallacea similis]|uniref:uncharacterized protein n=1 Tax=Euwallacea similis TaxID=1736056 RepID=UPI00344C5333